MIGVVSLGTKTDRQLARVPNVHMVQRLVILASLLGALFATSVCQAADAVAGKRLYPVCTACHGAAGQGNRGMGGPKLAGQQGFYLLKQLQNFQSGARGMAPGDAKGRQMAAMSKGPALSSAAALENLVAYLETLPDKSSTPTVEGDVARGKNLYATCVSCHGEAARKALKSWPRPGLRDKAIGT